MNLVDSSGWLEYFADGPGAGYFAPAIEKTATLLVPTLVLYEVSKRLILQVGERTAFEAVAAMRQDTVRRSGRRMPTSTGCRGSVTAQRSGVSLTP